MNDLRMTQVGRPAGTMLKHELQRDREKTWLAAIMRYLGLPLAIVLFYFLSLGPVTRFYATVVWAESGVPGVSVVGMVQVEPPYWIYVLYYPAFWLSWSDWAESTYGAYVRWWEPWDRRD